nr:uncharacterized protein LOC110568436 [Aotus nancymaae]
MRVSTGGTEGVPSQGENWVSPVNTAGMEVTFMFGPFEQWRSSDGETHIGVRPHILAQSLELEDADVGTPDWPWKSRGKENTSYSDSLARSTEATVSIQERPPQLKPQTWTPRRARPMHLSSDPETPLGRLHQRCTSKNEGAEATGLCGGTCTSRGGNLQIPIHRAAFNPLTATSHTINSVPHSWEKEEGCVCCCGAISGHGES